MSRRMLFRFVGVITMPLLVACAAPPIQTLSSDGDARMIVTCSGFFESWEACYERADVACKSRGYSVVQSSLEKPIRRGPEATARELLIVCRQ